MQVLDDARVLTDFVEKEDGSARAVIGDEEWRFEREADCARASNAHVTYEARSAKPFKQSKEINTNVNLRDIDLINEQKTDWILDENDVKLGQFTGANHGVRRVSVELEPDAELEDSEKVFLAWVARIALEEKMVATNWILSISLLILSVFSLLVFLF
ncbi:hypothetical protein CEPID_08890 [Corynebacterium epidermidicanis]|uniref:Uncharacterized protein n=2 Tax=Corynebacterium epidermidicanis TaxID=1050174 RepID=A0A0G3GRA3_9CORY|nr:hypothetical protein CEPID_08890 [Corynebacterium epidermidicanis]